MRTNNQLFFIAIIGLLICAAVSSCGKKNDKQNEKLDRIKSKIENLEDVRKVDNSKSNYPQITPEEIEAIREQRRQDKAAEESRQIVQKKENAYSKYRKMFKTYFFMNNQGLASEGMVFDAPNSQGRGRGAFNTLFRNERFTYQIQEEEDKLHITFDNKNMSRAIVEIFDDCLYVSINGEDFRFSKTLRE